MCAWEVLCMFPCVFGLFNFWILVYLFFLFFAVECLVSLFFVGVFLSFPVGSGSGSLSDREFEFVPDFYGLLVTSGYMRTNVTVVEPWNVQVVTM
jgi:hypothetical protein